METRSYVHTSFRKNSVTNQQMAEKVAGIAHARKYGCSFRNVEPPNTSGKRSVGCEKKPPITGLRMTKCESEFVRHMKKRSAP